MNDWVVTIGDSKFTGLAALVMFFFLIGVYLLPAILAMANRKVHKVTIGLSNLFLGWTVIVWIGCFIWSLVDKRETPSSSSA